MSVKITINNRSVTINTQNAVEAHELFVKFFTSFLPWEVPQFIDVLNMTTGKLANCKFINVLNRLKADADAERKSDALVAASER